MRVRVISKVRVHRRLTARVSGWLEAKENHVATERRPARVRQAGISFVTEAPRRDWFGDGGAKEGLVW